MYIKYLPVAEKDSLENLGMKQFKHWLPGMEQDLNLLNKM